MFPDKETIESEREFGVRVIYDDTFSPVLCKIPFEWVRTVEKEDGYYKEGFMVICQVGVLYRRTQGGRTKLVLKDYKVAEEVAKCTNGIVVKICKHC